MNMRERIADWIKKRRINAANWDSSLRKAMTLQAETNIAIAMGRIQTDYAQSARMQFLEIENNLVKRDCDRFKSALNAIAACETPSANGTVRRMANIAREALK